MTVVPNRTIARWVAPTLRELRVRKKKFGLTKEVTQRNTFIEWNPRAELFAFGKRLNESFDQDLLQQAFTLRSYINQEEIRQRNAGIDDPDIGNSKDNRGLAERGSEILGEYVEAFLRVHLPKLPEDGISAVKKYLLSEEMLAKISKNLGTTDIIFSTVSDVFVCYSYNYSVRLFS